MNFHGGRVHVHAGDCREVLASLEADSFDAVVCDPPYGLKFMNRHWDYDIPGEDTWRAVLRVLKPGGHMVAFSGTRTYHRMTCAIEDAGFEVRDAIMWHYGSGFPKSLSISKAIDRAAGAEREVIETQFNWGKRPEIGPDGHKGQWDITAPATPAAIQWQGWGSALKPATEIICLARKPLSEPTIAANVLRWSTGAINVDGCRVPDVLDGDPNRFNKTDGGSFAKFDTPPIVRAEGRWPANLLHDNSDEVVSGFPESDGLVGMAKTKGRFRFIAGDTETKQSFIQGAKDSGSAARFFASFPGPEADQKRFHYTSKADADDRLGSRHPTVKPVSLICWLARLITPPRGRILDCFAGTGTTAEAALREGFSCTLIEREAEYIKDIERRMALVFEGETGRSVAMAKLKPEGEPLPLFPEAAE